MYDLLSQSSILIIDDFAQFRLTIKSMLYKLGAVNVDQASNAVEAMKRCVETDYDIILCDYNMGEGQDGQQFLEELHHRHMLLKGSLFLMVTAESTSAQVMGAIEYRPDAYLTKPFTNDQLGQRLKRLLQRNRQLQPIHDAINRGDRSAAIELCDALTQQVPSLRFSCLRLKSEVLEQQQQFDELLALFQQVIDEQPLLWAELGVGKVHYARQDYQAALNQFRAMRDNFPQQVSILDWIARCQQQLGDLDQAEDTLKQAIDISPKSVARQAILGELAEQLEHHDIAQKAYQRTIEEGYHSFLLQPRHYRHYFDNTRVISEQLGGREQSTVLARTEAVAKKMERKYQDNPTALAPNFSTLATIFATAERASQADEFLSRLDKTLANPACRISEQEFQHIQRDLQRLDGTVDDNRLQRVHSRMGSIKQVIEQEQVNDKSARAINREGMQLAKQNQPAQALDKFREATQLMPHNPDYKLNAAQIILTDPTMQDDAQLLQEARGYLAAISLEHTGTRWRLYKRMKEMLDDGE